MFIYSKYYKAPEEAKWKIPLKLQIEKKAINATWVRSSLLASGYSHTGIYMYLGKMQIT